MNSQIKRCEFFLTFCTAIIAIAVFLPSFTGNAFASPSPAGAFPVDSTGRLQNSVRRMNTWLLGSEHAEGWRRYLSLNILETQTALGPQADIVTLSKIRDKFSSGVQGLDQPMFDDVRLAIIEQIENLEVARSVDLQTALERARQNYQPISIVQMNAQRDQVVNELGHLEKYYAKTMDHRDSDVLLQDLQVNELNQFLDEIKFELAPDNSVGKMDATIRDVRRLLNAVIEKIDAIPTPETDKDNSPSGPFSVATDQDPDQAPVNQQPSWDDLQKRKAELELQLKQLNDTRTEFAKQDAPRRALRRETAIKLRSFESTFSEVGKEQGDPFLVSAHQSLQRLLGTYQFGTSDNLEQAYFAKLNVLESDLAQIDGEDSRIYAGKVGETLRWLENANQVPALVTAIRQQYSQPNIYVAVSSGLINQISSQSVSDSQPVCESMLGRLVRGVSHTNGTVSIGLQDDPNQIHATIRLLGNVDSQTYIEQGRLRVCATACGQLEACRNVFANVGGLFADNAFVSARFQAYFGGTSSRMRIINRIAAKKFEQSRAQAEALTTQKAEDMLCEKFMEQTTEPINKGRQGLIESRTSAISKSQFMPQIFLRSFTHQILAVGKKTTLSTLGAANVPLSDGNTPEVSVRLHDSLPSNYIENVLAGKTFTDHELKTEIESLLGREPSDAENDATDTAPEDESFSITFPTIRPIQFEFVDNIFRVIVSGRRFAQADKKINEGLKIIFRFKIVQSDGQLKLIRDGEVEIEYLDKKSAKTVAFRSFLLGRLNPKEGKEQPPIELPANLMPTETVEALQDGPIATRLRLVQCRTEEGWLYLGWNYLADGSSPAWDYDLPAIWKQDFGNQE